GDDPQLRSWAHDLEGGGKSGGKRGSGKDPIKPTFANSEYFRKVFFARAMEQQPASDRHAGALMNAFHIDQKPFVPITFQQCFNRLAFSCNGNSLARTRRFDKAIKRLQQWVL